MSILLLVLFLSVLLLLFYSYRPRPVITGAASIHGLPFVGNALQLYHNPALTLAKWAHATCLPVLLVHLGHTPIVVVSGFRSLADLYANHSVALSSRPLLHTFHKVVSTVGSTPAGASFRRMKKCISLHLSNVALHEPVVESALDRHSRTVLKKLLITRLHKGCGSRIPLNDVCMLLPAQHFVLGVAVEITYGLTLDCQGSDSKLMDSIIVAENHIIRTRALFANYQDHLPFLSRWPLSRIFLSKPEYWSKRRDGYMSSFFTNFESRLQNNDPTASHCMLGKILSNPNISISATEIQSICHTMISAGLDNSALTYNHLMGHFTHPYGHAMQEQLHSRLMSLYDGDVVTAWQQVAISLDCDYASALLAEALRFFTVLPLGLPRITTKRIVFNGVTIPENTIVVMNAYEANHDPDQFQNPDEFDPERWLDEIGKINPAMSHLTFGVGSRKCSGDKLATRELYTFLCRMVLLFEVRCPTNGKYQMELDPFVGNLCPTATSFEPTEFRVELRPREGPEMAALQAIVLK